MFRIHFVAFALLFISSCVPNMQPAPKQSPFDPYSQTVIDNNGQMIPVDQHAQLNTPAQQQTTPANGKVAILLPLSGQHAKIGQSMLNAAQMALFDVNDPTFELIPIDTKGTAQGATLAVNEAARQNVKLILGPLLSQSVKAAGNAARRYNLNIIGFTTDANTLGGNIVTLGILPHDQGTRMAQFANQSNIRRVAIVAPNDAYANAVTNAFEQSARTLGIQVTAKIAFNANADINIPVQKLASMRGQFDALIMPVGNPSMTRLAETLNNQQLGSSITPWIGTGLWDSPSIKQNRLMSGALFTAPSPQLRNNFESKYRSTYTETPQRLASLAYDATALSVVLLRNNGAGLISRNAILNPNGFAGIDGIFRFTPSGRAERGLAIHQITGANRTVITDRAPTSFMR